MPLPDGKFSVVHRADAEPLRAQLLATGDSERQRFFWRVDKKERLCCALVLTATLTKERLEEQLELLAAEAVDRALVEGIERDGSGVRHTLPALERRRAQRARIATRTAAAAGTVVVGGEAGDKRQSAIAPVEEANEHKQTTDSGDGTTHGADDDNEPAYLLEVSRLLLPLRKAEYHLIT